MARSRCCCPRLPGLGQGNAGLPSSDGAAGAAAVLGVSEAMDTGGKLLIGSMFAIALSRFLITAWPARPAHPRPVQGIEVLGTIFAH